MKRIDTKTTLLAAIVALMPIAAGMSGMVHAQEQTASAEAPAVNEASAPEPLSEDELEILVARIALYPDDLVAVIASASLYALQIVEAQRFLEGSKTNKDLEPKSTWDGSVVSLMNYPDIVKMMSDDLDWTQTFGQAIVNQQQDVLNAIQQLRETAVAEGVIKTDDKVKVVKENDNIVIQPASAEVIYVPQYQPEMLYEPGYVYAPVAYYPDPYPYYYSPVAPFFAGFVTGAIWGGIVDWNDGFWGGQNNWGNDITIDCNNCFNNRDFNGKLNINDVDWKNIDRSKIKFDRSQFNKLDKSEFKNNIKANDRNSIRSKASDLKQTRPATGAVGGKQVKDVRASTLEGLKKQSGNKTASRPGNKMAKAGQGAAGTRDKKPAAAKLDRQVGKPKLAARPDTRAKNPSPLGKVGGGRKTKTDSHRGSKSMGGGMKSTRIGGGGGHKQIKRPMGGGRRSR